MSPRPLETLQFVCSSEHTFPPLEWIMWGFPKGKITVVDGPAKVGKTGVLVDLCARITSGGFVPCSQHRFEPTNVAFISAEDDPGTLQRRFDAAGGDHARMFFLELSGPLPTLPSYGVQLEDNIRDKKIGLVVLDPVSAFLDGKLSLNNAQHVREAFRPLIRLGEELGTAFVIVNHLGKSPEVSGLNRSLGSGAVTAAARSGFRIQEHRGELCMTPSMSNLEGERPTLRFRRVDLDGDLGIEWVGPSNVTLADLDAVEPSRRAAPRRETAAQFLDDELADGPVAVKLLLDKAEAAGISIETLRDAKKERGAVSVRRDGVSLWELPQDNGGPTPEEVGPVVVPLESEHSDEDPAQRVEAVA